MCGWNMCLCRSMECQGKLCNQACGEKFCASVTSFDRIRFIFFCGYRTSIHLNTKFRLRFRRIFGRISIWKGSFDAVNTISNIRWSILHNKWNKIDWMICSSNHPISIFFTHNFQINNTFRKKNNHLLRQHWFKDIKKCEISHSINKLLYTLHRLVQTCYIPLHWPS